MGHFKEFSQKFSLLPPSENKDINLAVAWWGKAPAVYHGVALNGFWSLPPHLKIDPGYFGEGFYLTRYPRYSDYYLNGFSMSKRVVEHGDILMCYTALGRPYPVIEDPFEAPAFNRVPASSLCGKPCGPSSPCSNKGSNAHDSHYVTVKLHPDAGQFFPCPLRQAPDFDEVVVFNPKRILPAAYVSFQRRRKTLLWLLCDDDREKVKSMLLKIPGYWCVSEAFESRDVAGGTLPLVPDYTRIKLEDQVDVTLFFSAPSMSRFMQANLRFVDYPPSLFRIVCAQQCYDAHDGLLRMLDSHPVWAANAPEVLVFAGAKGAHVGGRGGGGRANVRITADTEECFEFALFVE